MSQQRLHRPHPPRCRSPIAPRVKHRGIALLSVLLVGCSAAIPSTSPNAHTDLAPPPTAGVQAWLTHSGYGLRLQPLSDSELAQVRVTRTAAITLALASPPVRFANGAVMTWTHAGCVYLGDFQELGLDYVLPQRPVAAYVVQIIGPPVDGGTPKPQGSVAAVINAISGKSESVISIADVVFGTTCGS
jgi:hypothetical protein